MFLGFGRVVRRSEDIPIQEGSLSDLRYHSTRSRCWGHFQRRSCLYEDKNYAIAHMSQSPLQQCSN